MTSLSISRARFGGRHQRGFSLVEILVGVLIAMVGMVIMMEVLMTSDQRTRTTTAGTDAISNGAVMLHLMQRDVVQAGYGINTVNLLGCNILLPIGATIPLAPVLINPATAIIPAGDPNTDTMLIVYGSDANQPEGNTAKNITPTQYEVQSPQSFTEGDYVVAYPGSCTAGLKLAKVAAGTKVTVDVGQASTTILYNLGRAPRIVAYAVRNGALASCDFLVSDCRVASAANWTAVAGNIVSLRAQYARDTAAAGAMDGAFDVWDQRTPGTDPPPPSLACQWSRIPAVRFVLVARSNQYESRVDPATGRRACEPVTVTARTWSGSTGTSTAPIDLTRNPDNSANADWQCYRYKTFETVAPARNVVWMGTQASC